MNGLEVLSNFLKNENSIMNKMNILFCGDFAPCRRWYDCKPNVNVFGNSIDYIKESDVAFVNLECSATNIGKPILKDGPNLRTKPEWLNPLKEAGFNLLGLANNHFGDYGEEAVNDCIKNCKKLDLNTVGAGNNLKEAQKVFYFEKNNIKVAIINVCEHEYGIAEDNKSGTAPLDIIYNIKQIHEASSCADFVIMTIHGGNEYFPYPRPFLRRQYKFYLEQGCDAIICHHPHVPGAYEIYDDKPIFYSLGNFLFDNEKPPISWNDGYMVRFELFAANHKIKYELIPYTQSFEHEGIKLLNGFLKEDFLNRIEDYRNILNDKEKYEIVWNNYCDSKINDYLILQYSPISFRGIGRIMPKKITTKILLKKTKRLAGRLNYIRCESHHEVLLNIMTKELMNRWETFHEI